MPKLSESARRIGRKIGLDDDNGYGIAVLLALIVVVVIVAGFFVSNLLSSPVGYSTIYLLDENQRAQDYPQVVVTAQNSTFTVWVGVENHDVEATDYQVQVKVANTLLVSPLPGGPVQTLDTATLQDSTWKDMVTVNMNSYVSGKYVVVFELYKHTGDSLEFTHNYCVLNIQLT